MSGLTLKSMTTAESEFFAEETLITISPNFSHDTLLFTSGSFGPLEAGDPCVVPLWLAITLRKRGKCTIVIPDWMSTSSLEQNILNEKSRETFEPLPFHYREISQLLLNYARDDIKEPDRVAALLQDIDNIRMDRAKMGMIGSSVNHFSYFSVSNSGRSQNHMTHSNLLSTIDSDFCHCSHRIAMAGLVRQGHIVNSVSLINIASIEILTIRRFLVESLATMHRLTDDPSGARSTNDLSQDRVDNSRQAPAARPLRRFRS